MECNLECNAAIDKYFKIIVDYFDNFEVGKNNDQWFAYWMQMYLKGQPRFNIVENKVTPTMLTEAIVNRNYLYVSYIAYLFQSNGTEVCIGDDISSADMYIGMNTPVMPEETVAYTLSNLHEIVDLFERK